MRLVVARLPTAAVRVVALRREPAVIVVESPMLSPFLRDQFAGLVLNPFPFSLLQSAHSISAALVAAKHA